MVGAVFGKATMLREWLDSLLALIIAVLICISGIYGIPHIDVSSDLFVWLKRGLYLLTLIILLHREANRRAGFKDPFSICCISFFVFVVLNAGLRQEEYVEYSYYGASIIFSWLFVRYVTSESFAVERLFSNLRIGLFLVFAFALTSVLLSIGGDRATTLLILSGFNDNRVNFSIWLSQMVFLNFFLMADKRYFMAVLVASSVILVLQVFTGGRAGVLATLIIMVYFIPKIVSSGPKRLIIATGILSVVMASAIYAPALQVASEARGDETSMFRGMARTELMHTEPVAFLDGIAAHRLEITLAALKAMSLQDFYIGKGAGNSDVIVDGAEWMIHNVWLKTLSEFGVFGLLLVMLIAALPFLQKIHRSGCTADLRFMWGVGVMIGMLQPRFIIVGLSGCLVVWLCYALLLRKAKAVELVAPSRALPHDAEFDAGRYAQKSVCQFTYTKE